jgi:hypothetical protein
VQYVEGLNGETARHSRVSALAAEASWIMRVRACSEEQLDGGRSRRFHEQCGLTRIIHECRLEAETEARRGFSQARLT